MTAPVERRAGAHKQWEYCRVYINSTGSSPMSMADSSKNLQERSPISAMSKNAGLDEAVSALGTEGWELVGVVSGAAYAHLFFKRPKLDQ